MGRQKYSVPLIVIFVTVLHHITTVTTSSQLLSHSDDETEQKSLDTGQSPYPNYKQNENDDENHSPLNQHISFNDTADHIHNIKNKHKFVTKDQMASSTNKLALDKTFSGKAAVVYDDNDASRLPIQLKIDRRNKNRLKNVDVSYTEYNYHKNDYDITAGVERVPSNKWITSGTHTVINRHRRAVKDTGDLCQTEDCECRKDKTFLIVECKFLNNKQYTIGKMKFVVPQHAKELNIQLGDNTVLKLDEHGLNGSQVNRVLIKSNRNSNAIVEINRYAFDGNHGSFPEINITDCGKLWLKSFAFTDATKAKTNAVNEFILYVTNMKEVNMFGESFSKTRFHGYFRNIGDLQIMAKGFSGAPESLINIQSVTINNLQRIESALKEIQIVDSTIHKISREAFDVIALRSIILQNCKIGVIEGGVFSTKLLSEQCEIRNCTIGLIKSEAFNNSGITTLILEKNIIQDIEERAISVTASNFSFSHNAVKSTGYEWLNVKNWNSISILNNTFGNFSYFNIGKSQRPDLCLFQKNSITRAAAGSLNVTTPDCTLSEIYFYHTCMCHDWLAEFSNRKSLRDQSYCRIDDILQRCFNVTVINARKFNEMICEDSKMNITCFPIKNKPDVNFIDPKDLISSKNNNLLPYILIGVAVLITLVILVVCCVCLIKKYCWGRKPITIQVSEMNNQNTITNMKNSKSFSNDDRVIINRTLETMKARQAPEKYDQVYNNTKKLLAGNLTESEKVITIGEIVQTIEECPNTGEDFVAFTGILYKHLAPKDRNQNDPVYAEPTLPREQQQVHEMYNRDEDGQTILDHIYAEPHSVQQPLLTSEYSSPLDRNDVTGVYSEPIINEKEKTVITPYAIVKPLELPPPNRIQPSTSRNLPDVLSQSTSGPPKPMTKVQQIANSFSNNPNFHINRSPTTNRRIPQYTVPSKTSKDVADGGCSAVGRYTRKNNADSDSSNSHSDHSGGSDITYKIDEIEYADA